MIGIATATKVKREVYGTTSVYGGHHRAERVREADPDGNTVEHLYVVTQTLLDRLHADLKISDDQRDAGRMLRTDYDAGRINILDLALLDPGRPIGNNTGSVDLSRDEDAYRRYSDAMRFVSGYGQREAVSRVCLDDKPARVDWLRNGLDDLIRHYRATRRAK